ncbi:GNAT superfamily N-acetyltransferase [Fictibacillus halophilus]|uniref:GNAT superfamily N-acetyltransferase n=1 Tax=Fictibacillus halophilus TaxID=1610490 RepID=A0ABV2LNS7_9BACL|nr:GNAT family N-acetyltransferase [Fictibacillus halophilus]
MYDFMLEFKQHRNKRVYSVVKIKNLDEELRKEIKKIEENRENNLLNILHKKEEKIIVYRTIFDTDEKYGIFFIDLKVINKRGIVLNRIRLSANYSSEEHIELCDIEVFGENSGRGYGSILLNSLIQFAKENKVKKITGWISYADLNHFDKLDLFYKKNNFNVLWLDNTNKSHKAADIYWNNF